MQAVVTHAVLPRSAGVRCRACTCCVTALTRVGARFTQPEYTEHKLTFGAFLAALAAFIIDKFHVTPAKTSDVVVHVMTDYVTNLRRLEEVCDTSELRVPKAVAVMQKERSLVQQVR